MPEPINPALDAEAVRRLLAVRYPPAVVADKARAVYRALLTDSPRVRDGNFSFIAPPDLALLFELYDGHFFDGQLRRFLDAGPSPLEFKMSPRLTRSAGLTTRLQERAGDGVASPAARYEIAISVPLLFQSFKEVQRMVRVNGLVCRDRVESLQRVFEHELIHLLEMLVWGRSSCATDDFRARAWNFFGHTQTTHDLVTQGERASAAFDIRLGDRVVFELDGERHAGVVNRITKRATVLVESADGQPYSDGKRYRKFYVPLAMLKKA
jgi:hypothetical protein